MSPPSLQYLRIGDLVAAADGDPWAVDDSLQAGSPTQINFLAQAFHSAAGSATAAEETFRTAQQHFEQYNRENGMRRTYASKWRTRYRGSTTSFRTASAVLMRSRESVGKVSQRLRSITWTRMRQRSDTKGLAIRGSTEAGSRK